MNIRFAPELKSKIAEITPNVVHNRYDILYGDDYEMIVADDIMIPFHSEHNTGKIGLYLRDIGTEKLRKVIQFIFHNMPDIYQIFVLHTYTAVDTIEPHVHWHIDLPSTIQEFDNSLGKNTRRNSRQYPRYIAKDIGEYTIDKVKSDQCSQGIVQMYLDWKKQSHGFIWPKQPYDYLKSSGISDVYIMHTENETLAIGFVCDTGGGNAFFDNFTYNPKYATYSLGMVLYHAIIADMIAIGKKKFFLLGGDLEYKHRYNGIATMTYTGFIFSMPNFQKELECISTKIKKLPITNWGRKRIAVMYAWTHGWYRFYKNILKKSVTI